jgi:hypothetical protein
MRIRSRQKVVASLAFLVVSLLVPAVVLAENTDPANDGSQWAWAENVGWINGEPEGDGGLGLHVEDFKVSGWLWGENIGWISLTCENLGTCETMEYGVRHDGTGALTGWAWAENAGWIRFDTISSGVFVNVSTGELGGHAWGENIGWISFQSPGPHPYVMRTGWTCDPPPPLPIDPLTLELQTSGPETLLFWNPIEGATGYDVGWGFLGALRTTGDFYFSTEGCLADNEIGTLAVHHDIPGPGDGFWYLVRGVNCGGAGTYDSLTLEQVGPRDEPIGDSTFDCRVP